MIRIKRLYTTPVNRYFSINNKRGWKNVSMGAYDGVKVCELIGTFLLNFFGRQYDTKSIGLYRDDGLSILITVVVRRWKRLRNASKKYLRTMVLT